MGRVSNPEWVQTKTPEAPDPALLAPANLTAELVDGRVSLGWDAPAEDAGSVTGYEVLRARGEDAPGTLVADTGSATTYTDATADAPGESYAYRVKAVRDGERSQASGEAVIQLPDPPPPAPSGLAARLGSGGVVLRWQAPAEDAGSVTGYEILRARGKGELTILVADTGNAATAYTDATAGGASESYAYRVRAVRGVERSADSNEARVQLPPAAPRWAPGTASHDAVTLYWADPQDDSITGYRILRRESTANGPGRFVAIAGDTVSRDTAYTDDTVEPERFYVYRVHAISPQGMSGPSPDLPVDTDAAPAVATQETMPADPKSPSNLAAELTGGRVVLTWDPPVEDAGSVTGYEMLRAEGQGELAVLVADTGNTATNYTDTTASAASHAYRVKAIRDGERSGASNEAQVQLGPARPRGLSAAAARHRVTLSWEDPKDDSIDGYVILRGNRDSGAKGQLTELVPDTGTAANTYTDRSVAAGTSYTYRIKAINEYGTSGPSRWVYVETAAPLARRGVRGNVSEGNNADLPATTATTGNVKVGSSGARGEIAKPKDHVFDTDWFRVELRTDRTYRVDRKGAILVAPGTLLDPELDLRLPQINAIYDGDGDVLFNTWSRDESSAHHLFRVTFHVHDDGTYYIAASGESFEAGGYELRVIDITRDDDATPVAVTVQFGAASYTATEGGAAATVTVNLSADPERSVTIPITAAGADGAGSGDYTLSDTSVTIDSGQTSATFIVTATDDDVYDGAEALTLSFGDLPSEVTAAGTQDTTEVNLVDNEILSTSSLVPTGISAGDGFRLLFVTSQTRDATSTDIDDYNEFVQMAAAAGHEDIQPYSALFRALGSTSDVDAIDNTATTHTTAQPGVPIWWLNGPEAADDYGDFYDGSWDNRDPGRNESGSEVDFGDTDQVWTGTENDGTATIPILGSVGTTTYATPGVGTNLHFVGGAASSSEAKPLYGLSFVLHVVAAPPAVDSAAVSTDGAAIDIVFDEDLDTTGTEPAADAFEVTVDGGTAVNPASVAFHATDADTVVLTMSPAIAAGGTVTVAYEQPTSNALADAASNEVADFTGQAAPNRPAAPGVTLTAGNGKLTAAWAAPANGGSAITGYDVEWKTAAQTWAEAATAGQSDTAAAGATDHEITGLTNDTAYTVRVRAANDAGDGPWSTEASETPFSPPGAPGGLNAQATYRQVELSWTDPNNSDIEGYQYRVSDDGGNTWDPDWTEIDGSGASTTSLTLSGLDHRTEYTIGVRAVDARASGEAASVTATPAATGVPHDWALRPPGIATGETFRLLIVTSDRRNGESGDVDDYNDHVQDAVDGGHSAIRAYSSDFRALVGTRDGASPRDNTHSNPGSDGPGEQIWWLNGPKAADNYADLYDSDGWDHTNPVRTESGGSLTFYDKDDGNQNSWERFVWTGARADGTRAGSRHLGNNNGVGAFVGVPSLMNDPLRHENYSRTLNSTLRLYGLSPVFLVEAPDAPYATTAAITTDPANGADYRAGEMVKATVTFSEDVTVTGTPQLPLRIGDVERDADYEAGDSSPTVLSFSYLVTDDDTDRNGISIDAFALKLNGGSIKRKDTDVDAALTHTRVLAHDDQRVNLRPLITDIEVTSTPQATNANDTYGLGEDIEITVTFNEAVNVTGDVDFGISVSGPRRAPLKTGNGTTELVFAYTVQADDTDTNGIWIGDPGHDTIPTFDLQTGQSVVGAVSGLRADLDHDEEGTQGDHKVDGSLTAADATLSALSLSGITLVPAFAPGTTAYAATTSLSSTTVTIAISQGQNGANGRITAPTDADLNASGHQVTLAEDADTVITVTVTSSNSDSMRTYTVTVTRQAATDSTAPTVDSAAVSADGTTIDIVFDEDLDRTGSVPAADAFEVTVDGGTAVNPASVAFHASDADTVVLTMSPAIAAGATVSVDYDQPTSNALADAASNEVADFTGQAALNRPAAPVVTLTAGNGKLTATWAAPANGGSTITGYTVEHKVAGAADSTYVTVTRADAAALTETITGLTNDTEYTVRVRAGNDAGNGPWSTEASETPIAGDTTAPEVSSATVSSDGATIDIVFDEDLDRTGTAPAADAFEVTVDGGTAVNPASVAFHATDADTVVLTMSPAIAAGGTVSVAYDEPTSNALADAASNEVETFTGTDAIAAPNRPAAPVVTLTAGDGKLTATWSAPANGGSAITGYDVEWKTDAQSWAEAATAGQSDTAAADATTHEITGLTNGTAYTVRVRAGNDAGNGPWSAEASETPTGVTQVTAEFNEDAYTALEGRGGVTVTVNLSADPGRSVTIPITATENGDAGTGDYTLSADSVTINSGDTSATFTVTAEDDDYDGEGNDETLTLGFGTPLPSGVSAGTQNTTTVGLIDNEILVTSELVPGGIAIGGEFRLLFVTSGQRDATSMDISDYNAFVQAAAAAGHEDIDGYSSLFRALASTEDVGAKPNTDTGWSLTEPGVEIWWLNGPKAADSYIDFYDRSWDYRNPVFEEDGNSERYGGSDYVWTGTAQDGGIELRPLGGKPSAPGESSATAALPSRPEGCEIQCTLLTRTEEASLYGLSYVLRSAPPASVPHVTGVAVDPEPANDSFVTNDTITVKVTFSEAVSLSGTGTPTFPLEIGANTHAADYDSANSTDTVLVFTYQVTDDDTDLDGISSAARTFDVPAGAAINSVADSSVAAYPGPIALSTDFTVVTNHADLSALTVDDGSGAASVGGFAGSTTGYSLGVAGTVAQVTVTATTLDSNANAVIAPADADMDTAAHQVDLSGGKNTVTVTVTAAVGTTTKEYTLFIHRASVPHDWSLRPDGVPTGETFRVLFVTSTGRNGKSGDIAVYDAHVRSAMADRGHSEIRDYSPQFRALAATLDGASPRSNTDPDPGSDGPGEEIWWLNGPKAADDYADFYDGDWDHSNPARTESGDAKTFQSLEARPPLNVSSQWHNILVWTGTRADGTRSSSRHLGTTQEFSGYRGSNASNPHGDGSSIWTAGRLHGDNRVGLYGLSGVLYIEPPDAPYATEVALTARANGSNYQTGEDITATVTFSEAVTVSTVNGTPRLPLRIGSNTRYAEYQSTSSDGMALTFSYEVVTDDEDLDGLTVDKFALELNGGTIKRKDTDVDAALTHTALLAADDQRVNLQPLITGIEVTSTPKADPSNDTYGLGEDIEITVTFSEAVTVEGDEVEGDVDFGISVSGPRRAPLKSGNGTTELVFAYTVQSDDTDANGIFIVDHTHPTNPTFFELQGDQSVVGVDSGLDALLEHEEEGTQGDHKVDGSLTVADATLSALSLSGITLDQTFTAGAAGTAITSFTATTSLSSTTVTATPTQSGGSSGVVIDPADADTNTTGHQVSLDVGDTVITVTVTSSNGNSMRAYTITVTREAANGNRSAPLPPKNVRAVEEAGGVRLTWQPPDDATVTGYRIERRRKPRRSTAFRWAPQGQPHRRGGHRQRRYRIYR